jgi:hypothetical protein
MSAAAILALKLVLTPVLVGAASLAGRRWGSEIGGWLVGIPFTSGPVAFFLALSPGPRFAAAAAAGIMAGTASQATFCVLYAWVARRRGWAPSLVAATAGFLVVTALLNFVVVSTWITFAAMLAVLVVAIRLMPKRGSPGPESISFPRWDIPTRMVVATAFVVVLTAVAPVLGPRLAGLLAPFPLYATVLATFAHRIQGAGPAVGVLRGLLLGLFAFAAFFMTLAELLTGHGVALAFAAAAVVVLAVQGVSLAVGRRLRVA